MMIPTGAPLVWLLGAALAGGLARGFSGFGAALIFVPLAAVALGPRHAAPLMLALEVVAIVSLTPGAWRQADRREVGWLAAGLAVGTPLGALVLLLADPLALRWGVAAVILGLVVLLASGWRFRGVPRPAVALGFGMAGGVLGGIAMVSGPPAIAYLMGRDRAVRQLRADFGLYLAAGWAFAAIAYAAAGLLDATLLGPLLVAAPTYALGIWGGTHVFELASEVTFRRACFGMIALAAALSLPAWDGILR